LPFVIYADFEAINVKTYEKYIKEEKIMETFNIEEEENNKKTRKIEHQIAAAAGCFIHSDHENIYGSNYIFY
jgi:hypothetical protein